MRKNYWIIKIFYKWHVKLQNFIFEINLLEYLRSDKNLKITHDKIRIRIKFYTIFSFFMKLKI